LNNKLIFDLGFCNGIDTMYYLEQGFKVIAVEGNPILADSGNRRFKNEIEDKQLILLNKVISNYTEDSMNFYIHPDRIEWSSIYKEIAEQDGKQSTKVSVPSISLFDLIEQYGLPYYLKVDIEGCDVMTALNLIQLEEKPEVVSFELNKIDYVDIFIALKHAGYNKYQLRNQINNKPYSSGLFGYLLSEDKWLTFDEALSRYIKYRDLRLLDNTDLAIGWLDIHAKLN
jgi:FkbM family methyltransferase